MKTTTQPAGRPWWNTMLLLMLCVLPAMGAQAEVRLDNSIKKVESFVDDNGNVERRLVPADKVVPGDELQYTVAFTNAGDAAVDAGTIVITDVIPAHTFYVDGTAYGAGTEITFSVDGKNFASPAELKSDRPEVNGIAQAGEYQAIQWAFGPALHPGETGRVSFNVRLT
ncbi:MAG: hypothetical protein AAF993_13700 [Pseudomonadota bacterium]